MNGTAGSDGGDCQHRWLHVALALAAELACQVSRACRKVQTGCTGPVARRGSLRAIPHSRVH